MSQNEPDHLVIGGGFYGAALALFLRSVSDRVMLVEAEPRLMERASRVNQARIHTGFHYPRNALTAVKSMLLRQRFANDFPEAVVDNFQMLYAISRRRSKVSARRFGRMFSDMGAPIRQARPAEKALFAADAVEDVFACIEHGFDYTALRTKVETGLARAQVDIRLSTRVERIEDKAPDGAGDGRACVHLSNGSTVRARHVYNVTYAGLNTLLATAGLPQAAIKYEMAEIALVTPPEELDGFGITVMDGPFFSAMPWPAAGLYSLTHVRYTPHASWTYRAGAPVSVPEFTRTPHMIADARRYVPSLSQAQWVRSLYDIKTVLLKNEQDDGRPILFQRSPENSCVISIMGGKIDNIYDLFDLLRRSGPEWEEANTHFLTDTPTHAQ